MCGIVGWFQVRGDPDPDLPQWVQSARDRIKHRGPDGAGLYISPDGRCVLGHRRLAILDLSAAGAQPMANEDESVWIVFNGEIYNYLQLRKELVANGHQFRSATDTEVILHLYEEEGDNLVDRLDGMFAFVIYDARRRRLIGARDRIGVKPLYYAMSPRRFTFASEPKALLAFPDVSREPRVEEVTSYLAFNCLPGPSTLFRSIEKLEPGTRFRLSTDTGFAAERYWRPSEAPPQCSNDAAGLAHRLAMELRGATEKRMMSDVPFGAMLSGGVDSSLTVALMSEALGAPVKTFTIGYPGDDRDPKSDLSYARRIASQFGTDHHEVVLTEAEVLESLQRLPALADDPIGAPSVAANLHLARFTKMSGVTVAQVGEGADEVFCGYPSVHRLWRLHDRLAVLHHLLPRSAAGWLANALAALPPRLGLVSLTGAADSTVREQLRRYAEGEHLHWGYGALFTNADQKRLLDGRRTAAEPYAHIRRRINTLTDFHNRPYLDQLTLIDLMLGLPERLLMRVDKATMRYGVEARVPFLDPAVLRVAFDIPPRLRAPTPKAFLKAYAQTKLPRAVVARPKVGFPTAPRIFLSPKVLSELRQLVFRPRFVDLVGFDRGRLEELFVAAGGRGMRSFYHVWSLYVLSLWFHHWIEGND